MNATLTLTPVTALQAGATVSYNGAYHQLKDAKADGPRVRLQFAEFNATVRANRRLEVLAER